MKDFVQQSFKINLSLMTVFGLYSPKTITRCFKVRGYFFYTIFTICGPLLGTLYFILGEDLTMTQVNNNAFLFVEMGCQITKLLPFITNAMRIKSCIHYFDTSHQTFHRKKHQQILDTCSTICRRNTMIFVVSIVSGNVFWATRPFFSEEQVLPVDIWLPGKLTTHPRFIPFIYLYLVIAVGYTSISCAAIDPLIGGLVCLATGQLKILKDNLQHINEHLEEHFDKTKHSRRKTIIRNIIKHCINHHNSILKYETYSYVADLFYTNLLNCSFIREYEQCFSLAVFGQFLGSIVVICFCCLQISKLEPLSYNFISMVTFLSVFMAQIYVYCYYGTMLFEESNSLTNAVYMGKWYEYDIETRKALIILMERAKKPIRVTAGKILEMSVETFTTILKRSYSLLAVLNNQ